MDLERAKEINTAIVRNRMAVIMGEDWVPLPDVSLAEMLEATELVKRNQTTINADGSKTLHVISDPRGIAASYAFEQFGRNPKAFLEAVGYEIRSGREPHNEEAEDEG